MFELAINSHECSVYKNDFFPIFIASTRFCPDDEGLGNQTPPSVGLRLLISKKSVLWPTQSSRLSKT